MYSLRIKHTGVYDPDAANPDIVVTRDPDHPGNYIYSWTTYKNTMNSTEINGTLDEVWNGISTFTFNVYYGSPCWDVFFPARTAVRLWSEKEQKYIFNGRVADVTENMGADGILYRTVQCENELAYLCDSICDTKEVEDRLQQYNRGMNARDVLITMLELHHINAESIAATLKKGFMPPNSTWDDETNAYDYPSNCYPAISIREAFNGDVDTTWALIQDILINNLGMDIWVTYDDSVIPIGTTDPDNTATWIFGYNVLNMRQSTNTGTTGDPITISTNMKSLKIETSPTSNGRITRIVPLGGIGVNGRRLDVTSIPQRHEGWDVDSYEKSISNEMLSITYGHIDKVSLHEDLVDNGNKTEAEVNAMIQELYRRGKAEADALSGGITSISIEAVDLYEAGYNNAHKFQIGNYHRIVNDFFGLDDTFRLVRKVTDLSQPWNPKLEFAKGQTSQTNLTKNRQVRTSERIYNVENMISTRLDNSAVMRTTAARYAAMTSRNPTTVHYADQGDGTWKAYMGDEPIVFSDGGWEVETAAIVTTNINDFIINQELMTTITPETRLYYGGVPKFVVVQGHYCLASGRSLRSRITYDTATGKWLIDNNADLYDAIIANRDKFGSQLGTADDGGIVYGNLLTSADGVHKYPQSYRACIPVFTRIERGSSGWRIDIQYEHWDATNNDPLADWYGNLTHPTATNGGSFVTAQISPKTPTNGNNDTWLNPISDFFIVPVVYGINTTSVAGRDYGNVTFDEFLLFTTAEGYNGQYSVTGMSNNGSTTNAPLISAAELAFLQGLYQRSEPQEVTP